MPRRLADRIAAWFGYVPNRAMLPDGDYIPSTWLEDDDCGCSPAGSTITGRATQIIVSADFKRGIPCS